MNYMPLITRYIYILLERWIARFTDAIIVVTKKDIEKSLKASIGLREQYHLIRSAIPLDEFNPARVDRASIRQHLGLPQEAPVIGTIGRFSPKEPTGLGTGRGYGWACSTNSAFFAGG